jgi:F-type H+-transporting ATPase subunit b
VGTTIATSLILAATPGENDGIQLMPDTAELIWGAVGFALLMLIMMKFVFPKVNQTLEERSAAIQGKME